MRWAFIRRRPEGTPVPSSSRSSLLDFGPVSRTSSLADGGRLFAEHHPWPAFAVDLCEFLAGGVCLVGLSARQEPAEKPGEWPLPSFRHAAAFATLGVLYRRHPPHASRRRDSGEACCRPSATRWRGAWALFGRRYGAGEVHLAVITLDVGLRLLWREKSDSVLFFLRRDSGFPSPAGNRSCLGRALHPPFHHRNRIPTASPGLRVGQPASPRAKRQSSLRPETPEPTSPRTDGTLQACLNSAGGRLGRQSSTRPGTRANCPRPLEAITISALAWC